VTNVTSDNGPPDIYQPVPIHTVPANEEWLLRAYDTAVKGHGGSSGCTRYTQIVQEIYHSQDFNQTAEQYNTTFQTMAGITGYLVGNSSWERLQQIENLADPTVQADHQGKPLLPGVDAIKDDLFMLFNTILTGNFHNSTVGKLIGGNLIQEIKTRLKAIMSESSKLKWIEYSAHDFTIMALKAALNIEDDLVPVVMTNYNFELYFDSDVSTWYVKVVHNIQDDGGDVVTIPGCDDSLCPWNQFEAILNVTALASVDEWNTYCENDDATTSMLERYDDSSADSLLHSYWFKSLISFLF
jgi:hypothetical protein